MSSNAQQTLSRTRTLLGATLRDLLRRPGALLALAAAAAFVVIVPRLARRALDDGAALGAELVLSTTWLYATTFAGLAAARAIDAAAPLGLTVELLATPLRRAEFVLARVLGIAAVAGIHAMALLAVGALAVSLGGEPVAATGALGLAILAGALQVLLATAAGMALGSLFGGQLATVAIVAFLLSARLIMPALTESGAAWTWLLPDLARLDYSRDAAFGRGIGSAAAASALAAGLLQTLALLALTRAALHPNNEPARIQAG